MGKPKVLMLHTGGTVSQERGLDGVFRPSEKPYMERVRGVEKLADVEFVRVANLDSTNMQTSDRAKIAREIYRRRFEFDGFVVVHGTDTMADTAAALTYMVSDLGKPIILTGSQKSIFEDNSDAYANLYHAVKVATMDIGEVAIVFGDRALRGPRTIKESEQGVNAFASPRVQPIAELGIDVMLAEHRIPRHDAKSAGSHMFTRFDTYIEFYQQSSGTNTNIFRRYVNDDNVHGVVLGAYGAGNVQSRLVPHINSATKKGKPVLVVTNCRLGAADMGIYEVGSAPLQAGAISAGDMTMEAATQKLMYALGRARQEGYTGERRVRLVGNIIQRDYGRDITVTRPRFGQR